MSRFKKTKFEYQKLNKKSAERRPLKVVRQQPASIAFQKPYVSIVIPVFNAEKHLNACLDSVVSQTIRQIQIICVNDGSTDNSLDILREYEKRDQRIVVIDKPNGGGPGGTRNAAYSYIKGEYTLFVDSDDILEAELCEATYRYAEELTADLVIFGFDYHYSEGKRVRRILTKRKRVFQKRSFLFESVSASISTKLENKLFTLAVTPWSKLFKSNFLIQHSIYFPENTVYEDLCQNFKSIGLAKSIGLLPDVLYHYRIYAGSISKPKDRTFIDGIAAFVQSRREMQEIGIYDEIKTLFLNHWLSKLIRYYKIISVQMRNQIRNSILDNLHENEWHFILESPNVRPKLKKFYTTLYKGGFSLKLLLFVSDSSLILKSIVKYLRRQSI